MFRFYRGCRATFQQVLRLINSLSSSSPHPHPYLALPVFLFLAVLVGTLWCLKCGCIFMTNNIEYIFILIFIDHRNIWRRQWHPTPVLLPGKSHGRRSLVGCSPWGR